MNASDDLSVSVVIPTHNRARFLRQAIESILSQSLRPDQVIVVDDGSTDTTACVVRNYPTVTLITKENGGKASALNAALPLVTSEFVWFFDDDDVALPDALDRLVTALKRSSHASYCWGSIFHTPDHDGRLGDPISESTPPSNAERAPFVSLLETCYMQGATVFARTSCYRELGGFDERFRRSQDYHMALRLARDYQGVRLHGGPIYYFRVHAGTRGSAAYETRAADVWRKHAEYDRTIIREVCRELPLDRFAPSGIRDHDDQRLALLQRMSIYVIHRVYPEANDALTAWAESAGDTHLTQDEVDVLERMVHYTNGLATGDSVFADAVAEEARSRKSARYLRSTLLKLMLTRTRQRPGATQRAKELWRTSWLYLAGQTTRRLVHRLRT